MCQSDPDLKTPACVDWCIRDVLTYEEREVEVEEEDVKRDRSGNACQMKIGRGVPGKPVRVESF